MNKRKRIRSIAIAVVLVLSNLLSLIVSAADVTMDLNNCEVSWDYTLKDYDGNTFSAAYGIRAEDNPFGYAVSPKLRNMHDYTAKRPGLGSDKSQWVYGRDYVYCFCIEHGIPLPNANEYAASSDPSFGDKYERLSATQKDLLTLALAYGYTNRNGIETSKDANACYAATQLIIWQITLGFRTSATELNDRSYPMSGYAGTMTEQYCRNKYFKQWYDAILSDIQNHTKRPSFTSDVPASAKTYEMEYTNGQYTVTLTDTNNVLDKYYVSASGGVSVNISGNTLTVSSSSPINNAVTMKLNRGMPSTNDTTGFLIWSVPGKEGQNQDMVSGVTADTDPVPSYLKIQTAAGSAKIVKTSEDGEVEGITFTMTGNGINKTVTTGAGGTVQIDNLRPGVYTVTEQGYDKYEPQETRSVTVVSGQTATVTFNNRLKRGDLTVTKTAEDGLSKGMKFHLYGTSLSGFPVNEYAVVGSDGKARFQGVLIGSGYTLEEVDTPDRYIVPDKQTAAIEWNKVTNKSFDNDLQRGDLTVTKTAEDGLTEGMRFRLHGISYSGIAVDEYAAVGADGKAYFHDILIGSGYTLEEVNTPDRYVVPDNQKADIEWNKVTNKSFDNVLKKWNLTVTKRDSETGTAQGDASLAGAVYGIYKGERLIDRYTTDANGQFTTQYYLCGDDWSLREITPSEGYQLDEAIHHIGAEARNYTVEYNALSDTVKERNTKGRIAIIKHTDDGGTQIETPEVGAEFEVYLKSSGSYDAAKNTERDYLVCDENGFAETKFLPYGVYTVRQTKGWPGRELIKPFDVYISKNGQTYRYLINNGEFESLIEIVKKDMETGKVIPVSGIGFKVRDLSTGEFITQHINYPTPMDIDIFYTDSTGKLMLPEPLGFGNYEIIEQCTAYGYVLDSTPVPFTVDGSQTVVTVEKHNTPQKGMIKISKTGEVFSSVMESGGLFQPGYSVKGLAGAVYEVTAAEDIVTPDGTLRYARGTVVAKITTGADGTAKSKELYLGKYKIVEKKAPFGMTVSDKVYPVELTYAGQEVEITETAASFHNERQQAAVSLSKVLEKNDTFGMGNNNEILSVQFGLFAAETLTAADGSVIPADGLIEMINCDENGIVAFTTDIPIGAKLYVKELAVDNHYLLSDKKYPVEFSYQGQEIAHVEIKVNDGNAIENNLIYGNIKGLKTDENGAVLEGALIGLFQQEETDFTTEHALMTAKSAKDGSFSFTNVPYGNWLVREIESPAGYVLSDKIFPVAIDEDGAVIEITLENKLIRGEVKGLKTDENGAALEGALIGLFQQEETDFTTEHALMTAKSAEDGSFSFTDVPYGNWLVREIESPTGYVLSDEIFPVAIDEDGVVIEITLENKLIRGDIKGLKIDENGAALEGALIGLFQQEETDFTTEHALMTAKSAEDGSFSFTDVPYGNWLVREIESPTGYVLSDEIFPVAIDEDGVVLEITLENKLIRGDIKGLKIDENGAALEGALIGLFQQEETDFTTEHALMTAKSAEDGSFSFTDVPYGNWLVREIESPTGYVLSDEIFPVTIDEDGAVIEITLENQHITGHIQLTKVDKDYPDNKLTGAAFAVYRDSNGNKELDPDDALLGTLTETSTDVYEMTDLIYGGYFVKEIKAPEGFCLDENAYYVEITEHGKTYEVENEAGKGFVNAPQTGSLKIIKTSSDNTVEGFSFRVTGPNGYSQIFTTNEKGEILIENLRIGDYTVSEISDDASAAYVLPADKTASVFEGAVTVVQMHNELSVRDTPQTGDNSNSALWLALFGISAAGAMILCLIGRKKNNTEKEI